jgi:pseudouridine kinase
LKVPFISLASLILPWNKDLAKYAAQYLYMSILMTDRSAAAPPYVALVGAANLDIIAHTPTVPLTGDSTPGRIHCAAGGVARNVAENLARLGQDARLITAVGDDLFGHSLRRLTLEAGVDVVCWRLVPEVSSATYLSLHGADGDMSLAVNDMAVMDCITPQFLSAHQSMLEGASCWVLDCNLSPDALAWLMTRQPRPAVFVDAVSAAKCRRILPWLDRVHTLKVNRLEAQALTGEVVDSAEQAAAAVQSLRQMGVGQVVLSLGGQGVCWADAGGVVRQRCHAELEVVNASGAGDALLSGLVHAHLTQLEAAQAVPWAMACAELTLLSPLANAHNLSIANVQQQLALANPTFS